MFADYFHQTLNYLKSTSNANENMSNEQQDAYYKIPSQPLKDGKNSSIFTRSQCLGNNLCSANCLVHKKRKRRPKSTVQNNESTINNNNLDINLNETESINEQDFDDSETSSINTSILSNRLNKKMSTNKTKSSRRSQFSDDDEIIEHTSVNRYNYYEDFSTNQNESNTSFVYRTSSSIIRQSIYPFLIGLLIVLLLSIFLYLKASHSSQEVPNSIFDYLNINQSSFIQNEEKLDQLNDQINLKASLRAIETFKQELKESFSQLNKRLNKLETNQQELSKLIDSTNKMSVQIDKQDQIINELTKYKFQIDKFISEFSLINHDELKSKFNDIRQLIIQLIKDAIDKYDADKTGIVDYASEFAGGEIVSTGCTENYDLKGASYKIFGVPIYSPPNIPRFVIQPNSSPGQCWFFKGNKGSLVIKLSRTIMPSNFSYEHIPIRNAPDGHINSAPKHFEVRALDGPNADDNWLLGEFEYDHNGEPIQFFKFENTDKPVEYIEFNILDNHGNDEFTCLYRIRVHGIKVDKED